MEKFSKGLQLARGAAFQRFIPSRPASGVLCRDLCRLRRDTRPASGGLILLWDVSLAKGGYSGGVEARLPAGAKYNGQAVTLLHCRNNMLESQSALVGNGVASGMFGGFSPFAVAADGGAGSGRLRAGNKKAGGIRTPAVAGLLILASGACNKAQSVLY